MAHSLFALEFSEIISISDHLNFPNNFLHVFDLISEKFTFRLGFSCVHPLNFFDFFDLRQNLIR